MKLIQRVGYYLGGFSLGLIVLAFFLNGKKVSCDYGPNARVIKNIRIKKQKFSSQVEQQIASGTIDSTDINFLLYNGNVNFSESNTNLDSCKIYVIEGKRKETNLKMTIKNCDSLATIQQLEIKKAQ